MWYWLVFFALLLMGAAVESKAFRMGVALVALVMIMLVIVH